MWLYRYQIINEHKSPTRNYKSAQGRAQDYSRGVEHTNVPGYYLQRWALATIVAKKKSLMPCRFTREDNSVVTPSTVCLTERKAYEHCMFD